MSDVPDAELLEQFARNQSEAAFAELVRRHIGLVYSTAFRKTEDPQQAEDITQVVFIILARKAGSLSSRTVLPGWLYHTTRLTAANLQRAEFRRIRREQEVFMQSTTNESAPDALWRELSPLLEDAMAGLGASDRDAIVLRFFQNRSLADVGAALGIAERAAQKRVDRALEKLRKFFTKRGVASTTAIIAGAISSNSVQTAPAGLAKTISAVALAKGATASASTLTLVKGALKIMAWTKAQTAVAASIGILLVAGTTTITIREIQKLKHYPWEVPNVNLATIRKFPPQAVIVPTIYDHGIRVVDFKEGGGAIGICQPVANIVRDADAGNIYRMVFAPGLPEGNFDYFARGRNNDWGTSWQKALQAQLYSKLGVIEKPEVRNADVWLLEYKNPYAGGLQPPGNLLRAMELPPKTRQVYGTNFVVWFFSPVSSLGETLQALLNKPVIDRTGLAGRFYDFKLTWDTNPTNFTENLKDALSEQLGLELVPTNMPYKMLVVEKANPENP